MSIQANAVVSIHYAVSDESGEQLDSSAGKDPLTYLHGANNIISGLEKALEGKDVGDQVQVNIPPEEAYGERMEQLVEAVPREAFGDVENLEVGMRFQAQTDKGEISVVITDIEDDQVTVDGNHPLAGKALNFDVEVSEVREATEEEIAHGHAHGAGGVEH